MAKELEKMGAHFLAIKDMAGVCRPYAAYQLVKALKQEIGIPIHFHTHDTAAVASAFGDGGQTMPQVDVVDLALASHVRLNQPAEPQFNCCSAATRFRAIPALISPR